MIKSKGKGYYIMDMSPLYGNKKQLTEDFNEFRV